MKKTIVFILHLGILVHYVYSQQAKFCASKGKCDDCIRTYGCAWCSDPNFKDRRCLKATESTCPGIYLVNPTINTTDFRAEPLSNVTKVKDVFSSDDTTASFSEEIIVQVSPQYLKLQLRPNEGHPYKFKLWYKQALDYPIDLYYLMDLSHSIDKDKLSSLADELVSTMRSITGNFRLGFGSFVDKVVMPYVSIVPKNLKEPCLGCAAPYGFQNAMPLSQDTSKFAEQVKNAKISGNLDDPEGGFDAIMQAVVCRDEIGWREHARKFLVFSTDSSFHYAGDGKLGGIIKPNDGCCHLDGNGLYTHSNIQDYPSVSQINLKVKENFINLIFAVTADQVDLYTQLSELIEGSSCGTLSNNSKNIVDLVKEQYNKIRSSVEWREKDMLNIFGIRYFSKCLNPDEEIIETNKCENLTVGQMVEFEVELELKTCPPDPKDWQKRFSIYPIGGTENLVIEVELLCDCDCENPAHSTYEANSPKCSYHGALTCGVCECYPGYSGENCGCTSDGDKTDQCHPPNVTQLCSGRGSCKCNKCYCDSYSGTSEAFYGDYCECNDFNCPCIGGKICSGRGACKCGKCICEPGWIHEDCSCEKTTTNCIPAGSDESTVCSGNGNCVCNECVCHEDKGFFGKYCNRCPNCETRCDESVHQSGPLRMEECDKGTANITVVEYPKAKLNKYFANISSQFDWKTIEKEPKPWPPLNESHIKDAADKKHQIFINNLKRTFQSEFYPQKIHCEFSHENFSIITYKIYVTFEGTIYEGKMFTTFAANFDPITFNLTRSKDLKEYHIQHSNDAYKPVKLTSSPYNFSESLITEYIKNTSISIIHEILRQNSESFLQTDFCTLQKTSDNYTIQIPRLRAIDDGSSEWQNITIEGLFNYQSVNVMPHVGDDGIEVEVQFFTKTVTGSMVSSSNSTRFTFKIDRLLLKNNITEGTIYVEALDNILVDPPLPLSHNSKKELESIIANSIKNPPEVT